MTTHAAIDKLGLTLGELEAIETATGLNILTVSDAAEIPLAMVVGLVWVVMRRDDPTVTVEDVRNLDLGEIDLDTLAAKVGKAKARSGSSASGRSLRGNGTSPRRPSPGRRSGK